MNSTQANLIHAQILSLGFEKSTIHLSSGMEKWGHKDYKKDILNTDNYFYIHTETRTTPTIQAVGFTYEAAYVMSVKEIVDYMNKVCFKLGERQRALAISALLEI